jgi:hypothetical protein
VGLIPWQCRHLRSRLVCGGSFCSISYRRRSTLCSESILCSQPPPVLVLVPSSWLCRRRRVIWFPAAARQWAPSKIQSSHFDFFVPQLVRLCISFLFVGSESCPPVRARVARTAALILWVFHCRSEFPRAEFCCQIPFLARRFRWRHHRFWFPFGSSNAWQVCAPSFVIAGPFFLLALLGFGSRRPWCLTAGFGPWFCDLFSRWGTSSSVSLFTDSSVPCWFRSHRSEVFFGASVPGCRLDWLALHCRDSTRGMSAARPRSSVLLQLATCWFLYRWFGLRESSLVPLSTWFFGWSLSQCHVTVPWSTESSPRSWILFKSCSCCNRIYRKSCVLCLYGFMLSSWFQYF